MSRSDVCRTYATEKLARADLQRQTENILASIARLFPDVGYCQGMSFIAGEILHVVENEELAFWLFAGLIDKHNLRLLFAHVRLGCDQGRACLQSICTCTCSADSCRSTCRN